MSFRQRHYMEGNLLRHLLLRKDDWLTSLGLKRRKIPLRQWCLWILRVAISPSQLQRGMKVHYWERVNVTGAKPESSKQSLRTSFWRVSFRPTLQSSHRIMLKYFRILSD